LKLLAVLSLPLLLAGAPSRAPQVVKTSPPKLLLEDYGYLSLRPENEYREYLKRSEGDEEFVPLAPAPTSLSAKALFDSTLVFDKAVPLAVDGDAQNGYALIVDLNANGSLADDPRWPMHPRTVKLPDFSGAREEKQAQVAEVDAKVAKEAGGDKVSAPIRLWVALTEDMVRIPGETELRRQAVLSDATLREGTLKSRGRSIRFAVTGAAGIYGDDFNSVLFDLDGDGKLNPKNRLSREYFWVWEREVNLNGEGFEFSVDRYGRNLTLTPLLRKVPERASLEAGHEAPDFAFTDLDGRPHRLKDYRGKVVLLDFWGTWCQACAEHAPTLTDGYVRLHEKGFEILGIHGGGTGEQVREFIAEHGMTWPQTLETEAPRGPLQKLYRFLGAPNYFLIGRDGRILVSGVAKPAELIRKAEEQLR
jgi:peroxiredoxin